MRRDAGSRTRRENIRAWRQALLWLLRSLYVARMAVCYFVMIRGRHASPDLIHGAFSAALFLNLMVFLVAFFEYFPTGRRVVLVESWTRLPALLLLVTAGMGATVDPPASLGWARGWIGPGLLALEFLLLPLATLRLTAAIGGPRPARG